MDNKKRIFLITFIVTMGCLIMAWVDAVISPQYAIKSSIKPIFFLIVPIIYSLIDKEISLRTLFIFNKKGFVSSLLLGLCVFSLILGLYFILSPYLDLSNITTALENDIGVNINNFIFVAIYISLINSLLEEFFFRGFAFLILKKVSNIKFAYIFSATTFSLYHVAIMKNWFSPLLFILLIISLFISGLLFNWLNRKNDNIYNSWMVHMFANFAINTIGFILLRTS